MFISKIHLRAAAFIIAFAQIQSLSAAEPKLWMKVGIMADQMSDEVPDDALKYYKQAIDEAKAAKEAPKIIAAQIYYYANAQYNAGHSAESIETFKSGLDYCEKNGLKGWQVEFLYELVTTKNAQWTGKKADPAPLLKVLELIQTDPSVPTERKAKCYQSLGDTYLSTGNLTDAEKYIKLALQQCEQLGDEDWRIADLTMSMCEIRFKQKRRPEALQLLAEACRMHPSYTRHYSYRYASEAGSRDTKSTETWMNARKLFDARKYSELDKTVEKMRSTAETEPSGGLLLDDIYGACGMADETDAQVEKRIQQVKDWIKQNPKSATAKILLADILTDYAWKARGSGFADSVSREGWRLMDARLKSAWASMNEVNPRPIDWYKYALRVGLGLSWDKTQYNKIYDESRKRFPSNDEVCFSKAYWLQPKWHGSPGEAESFIQSEMKKRTSVDANVFYARMMWNLDSRITEITERPDFDWKRMKAGLEELSRRYPKSETVKAAILSYSLRVNDKETLAALGVNLDAK